MSKSSLSTAVLMVFLSLSLTSAWPEFALGMSKAKLQPGPQPTPSAIPVALSPLVIPYIVPLNNPLSIADDHSCVLQRGAVACWGNNRYGQSVPPAGLKNPRHLETSHGRTCVIDDGGVRCWGLENISGENTPPSNLKNPRQLSMTEFGTCALDDEGVKCWGNSFWAEYGEVLKEMPTLKHPRQVSVSYNTACAIDDEGVKCWGSVGQWRLPDFNTTETPILLAIYDDGANCAVFADDSSKSYDLHCWGKWQNMHYAFSEIPLFSGLKRPQGIFRVYDPDDKDGSDKACVLDDGILHCRNVNSRQILDTPTIQLDWASGAVGPEVCGVNEKGIKCWGSLGTDLQRPGVPLKHARDFCADMNHGCLLDDDGVKCWGSDANGESAPPLLSHPREVACGGSFSCAIDDDGVKCWGGQENWLDGDHLVASDGGAVDLTSLTPPSNLRNPHDLVLGSGGGCVFTDEGLKCWGSVSQRIANMNGKNIKKVFISTLGGPIFVIDDNGVESDVPVVNHDDFNVIPPPSSYKNPVQVSAASYTACVLDDNGIRCFGDTYGKEDYQLSPPKPLIHPREVSAWDLHRCALDDDGVKCWGFDGSSYAGMPVFKNPRKIVSGYDNCALDDDGVKCWSINGSSKPLSESRDDYVWPPEDLIFQ